MNPLDFLFGKTKPTSGARPGWPPAPQGQFPSSWGAKKPSAPVRPPIGIKGAGRLLGPAFAIPDIIEQVNQIRNPQDNIITRLGALGNSFENVIGSGGGAPKGAKPLQKRPDGYSTYGTYTVGGIEYDINSGRPTYMPPGAVYSSNSSTAFSPAPPQVRGGGSPGPGSFAPIDPYAAQNREYERERARVEAMVKANPDMQKQAIADERAKVRDQGMAIWAQKNPELAKQVKPGAVGYDAIQRGIGIQSIPSIENRAEFSWNQATQGPTPAVPMADAMLNPASPNFIGGEGRPLVNFADPQFENMSPEEFQKLLNQYTKR